jgi:hypothetical protein
LVLFTFLCICRLVVGFYLFCADQTSETGLTNTILPSHNI